MIYGRCGGISCPASNSPPNGIVDLTQCQSKSCNFLMASGCYYYLSCSAFRADDGKLCTATMRSPVIGRASPIVPRKTGCRLRMSNRAGRKADMRGHCEWSAARERLSLCWVISDEQRQHVRLGSKLTGVIGGVGAVAACAVAPPSGPTVMALPPPGKSLAFFQREDGQCRNYAASTTGNLHPGQVATRSAVGSAAAGTLLGAATGAAIGAAAGNDGAGAAIGGATGLVGGTAVDANNAVASEYDLQTRYNIAYTQCMYSLGDTVQSVPPGWYSDYGYAGDGYSWYDWGGPDFFGGGVFVFDRRGRFHHAFHDGHQIGFHSFHGGGSHGGGGRRG